MFKAQTESRRRVVSAASLEGGEGEIRTPEPLRAAGFQDRCIRPLCHLSGRSDVLAQSLSERPEDDNPHRRREFHVDFDAPAKSRQGFSLRPEIC